MKVPRHAPCPCGSGQKYKKCCWGQAEKSAAEARARRRTGEQALDRYIEALDALSNETNDLIRAGRWDQARTACERLVERFPEETDGDERFSDYYKQRGDFSKARLHAQAALQKVEAHPEKFEPELVTDLKAEIDYLATCSQAGRTAD